MKEIYNKAFPIELVVYKNDEPVETVHYIDWYSIVDDVVERPYMDYIISPKYRFTVTDMRTGEDLTEVVMKDISKYRGGLKYGCN